MEDLICVCFNKLKWHLISGERLIKPRNSLYFAKTISVDPFFQSCGVKHCFNEGYLKNITDLRQTQNTQKY